MWSAKSVASYTVPSTVCVTATRKWLWPTAKQKANVVESGYTRAEFATGKKSGKNKARRWSCNRTWIDCLVANWRSFDWDYSYGSTFGSTFVWKFTTSCVYTQINHPCPEIARGKNKGCSSNE